MKTENTRIDVVKNGEGDLTQKQYKALEDVVRLSPGYHFAVLRYAGASSSATHIQIWRDGNDLEPVGLVGKDCAQPYDSNEETKKVVRRVSHRVYHKILR